MIRYSRPMSCADGSRCPKGGRLRTHFTPATSWIRKVRFDLPPGMKTARSGSEAVGTCFRNQVLRLDRLSPGRFIDSSQRRSIPDQRAPEQRHYGATRETPDLLGLIVDTPTKRLRSDRSKDLGTLRKESPRSRSPRAGAVEHREATDTSHGPIWLTTTLPTSFQSGGNSRGRASDIIEYAASITSLALGFVK